MPLTSPQKLAIPAVLFLISFLAFSSQFLFAYLAPGPPSRRQSLIFNTLVACLLFTYYKSCATNPGFVPKDWVPWDILEDADGYKAQAKASIDGQRSDEKQELHNGRRKWCRKCEVVKPPRTHHCKICGRCIPRMDHHCPWTYNCVSYTTLPHFIRFLVYTNVSLAYLTYLLFPHLHDLWINRALPSYLGPNVLQLVHLMSLLITLTPTFIVLLILLVRTIWNLVLNQTTIENWEIERHATLARRARFNNGFVDGPNGMRVRLKRYEFPYDIGIYKNIAEGMGSRNPLIWLWPFASTVSVKSGYDFEVNGFEDSDFAWPPPDPDRMSRKPMNGDVRDPFTHGEEGEGAESWVQAVRKRQMDDQKRFGGAEEDNYESESDMADDEVKSDHRPGQVEHIGGEEVLVWRNDDGERLADFGIDEEAEWREEDVPLGELIRRRKAHEIE